MSLSDQAIEQEIIEKGLTAPRVTVDRINEVCHKPAQFHVFPGTTVTVCLLELMNGFTVTGESACASPENFDEELGRKIAYDNAKNKVWQLEGYLLKQRLYEANGSIDPFSDIPPHQQRVIAEKAALDDKIDLLAAFIGESDIYVGLPMSEKSRLIQQLDTMRDYSSILQDRIDAFVPA